MSDDSIHSEISELLKDIDDNALSTQASEHEDEFEALLQNFISSQNDSEDDLATIENDRIESQNKKSLMHSDTSLLCSEENALINAHSNFAISSPEIAEKNK